ncbi:MAG TPA: opacity family porin, partial [Verrucomicrobiae bacterium]
SVQVGGGGVLGIADSEFDYTENGGNGSASVSGSNSHTGLNIGAYAELGFAYKLTSSTSLYTGAQYEYLGNFSQSNNGHSAELDLGSAIFYEFGLQWNF